MIVKILLRLALSAALAALAACHNDSAPWHMSDISGAMPPLEFSMVRANDGATVTGESYHGRVTLLYFGYTHCPDLCPTTLSDLSVALKNLGDEAKRVSVLFVTVDPNRDTVPVLRDYVTAFAPEIDGLRGTPDALLTLTRRYRVAFSVKPAPTDEAYEVTHSSAVFTFDGAGKARLVTTSTQDKEGIAADLRRLVEALPPEPAGKVAIQ